MNGLERRLLAAKLMLEYEKECQRLIKQMEKEKHLSDVAFVNQNARGK